jgi:glycosyltransferase involved in cell wall biosynthesis
MRILEVCVDLDGGGIDRYLYNYCTRMTDIRFDFAIIQKDTVGILEKPLEACGFQIYRVPRQRDGLSANYRALKRLMQRGRYDAVHVHLGYLSAPALLAAKNSGIRVRIAHAHIAAVPENEPARLFRRTLSFLTQRLATHLAACGTDAAAWVWGEQASRSGRVTIHRNAIAIEDYAYSAARRQQVRERLGLTEAFVVGHVGRLSIQKNQLRLLDIFQALLERQPNACLLLIGQGELEEQILCRIHALGLQGHVRLLGVRADVPLLLNGMDLFLFPSLYEGLPFTLIETQCNGLPCVSSDAVTAEAAINANTVFLSLEEPDSRWAELALQLAARGRDPQGSLHVRQAGFALDTEVEKLRRYYTDCVGGAPV